MSERWLSGNSYLRLLSAPFRESNTGTTIFTQSESELQLALEAIQLLNHRMNYGKAKIEIQRGRINISIRDSKETW